MMICEDNKKILPFGSNGESTLIKMQMGETRVSKVISRAISRPSAIIEETIPCLPGRWQRTGREIDFAPVSLSVSSRWKVTNEIDKSKRVRLE
jgi:hypothetical protein